MNRSIGRSLALGMAISIVLNTGLPGWSETIKNPKQPVNVQLTTDVLGTKASQGQIFIAKLNEDLAYKNWSLPAGTVFRGEVTKVRHSQRFGRPGYVVMQVEEAELPNGTVFTFDPDKYEPCNAKTRHHSSLTATQAALQQLPLSAVGLAVTLPLTLATSMSGVVAIPIGAGARSLAGAGFAVMDPKNKQQPPAQTVAAGALDGSGLPRLMGFLNKYPEPEYKAGAMVPLHFNPQGLQDLFIAASRIGTVSQAMPLEPAGPLEAPKNSPTPNLVKSKAPSTAAF